MDLDDLITFLKGGNLGNLQTSFEHSCQEEAKVQENIFYIVAAVVINERNEVLMMQEAKPSCFEKWYLPAGKMEPGENIVEATKREVKEETGLDFSPRTVLCVEECGGRWVRIALTGEIIGGSLKLTADGDEESLQACWWDTETSLTLRSKDVIPLIHRGLEYHKLTAAVNPRNILPTNQSHTHFMLRVLFLYHTEQQSHILQIMNGSKLELPTICVPYFDSSIQPCLTKIVQDVFREEIVPFTVKGACGIEHDGATGIDGLCLNIFVSIDSVNELPSIKSKEYSWNTIPYKTKVFSIIRDIFENKFNIIPISSLKLNKN